MHACDSRRGGSGLRELVSPTVVILLNVLLLLDSCSDRKSLDWKYGTKVFRQEESD